MSVADYIEFTKIDKTLLNWRDLKDPALSDWVIEVCNCESQETKQYRVLARQMSKSSDLFYKIATKALESIPASSSFEDCRSEGDVTVKLEDGTDINMQLTQTIRFLKEKILELFSVPVRDQVLSPGRHTEPMPLLCEDWRTLAEAGLTKGDSLLVLQYSWQRVDPNTKTVRLDLPGPCAEAFEDLLDCMYCFGRDPDPFSRLSSLEPDAMLGALWLAGRLEMPEAQRVIASHLLRTFNEYNAHVYLRTAVALGFVTVQIGRAHV